jgi:secreted trypsin-like serine protease
MKIELKTGKYYVIGLSSFGIGCGKVGSYGIHTKVDYFTDWNLKPDVSVNYYHLIALELLVLSFV